MNGRLSPRRRTRASRWLVSGLVIACLVLSMGVVTVGCGGDDTKTDTTAATGDATTTTAATSATTQMTGKELGEAIGATWAEAMQALNAALAGKPEASTVRTQLEEIKEQYVQKMVVFGKQKQALDSAAQAEVNAAVSQSLSAAGPTEWYKTYMANYDAYSYASGDVDFTNLLADFNILTQYADFELLKTQEPDEATRLGIK
jgi:hypothetical protein